MRHFRVKKDVLIYHPSVIILEKDSTIKCENVVFGVIGDIRIMNEKLYPEFFEKYFEELDVECPNCGSILENSDLIFECWKCGKKICENCMYISMDVVGDFCQECGEEEEEK